MIDFDALVLGPAMTVFAKPIIVNPVRSQPGHAAYAARGVWAIKPIDVQTEDGSVMSSRIYTLGVKLSEFLVPPTEEDQVTITNVIIRDVMRATATFLIDDVDPDGQGGAVWTLKSTDDPRTS